MPVIEPPAINLVQLAQRLKALSDPKRLLILHTLMEGVQCNCELGDVLQMPANLISHHLRVLREAGLVTVERDVLDGRWIYYAVNPGALAEINQMAAGFFDPARIKPRRPTCGPQGSLVKITEITVRHPEKVG